MAGFGLEGVEERIPCPHCESTDCCGIKSGFGKRGTKYHREWFICIRTGEHVSEEQLWDSVRKHGLEVSN